MAAVGEYKPAQLVPDDFEGRERVEALGEIQGSKFADASRIEPLPRPDVVIDRDLIEIQRLGFVHLASFSGV